MKNFKLILVVVLMVFLNCNSQNHKKEVINMFINKMVLDKSYDISNSYEFLTVNKDSIKKGMDKYIQIQFGIFLLREKILEKNGKFEIVTYKDFKNRKKFKNYNIIYENSDAIYCIISQEEFILPIIINDNNRIASFYTGEGGIIKNISKIEKSSNIHPFMLY